MNMDVTYKVGRFIRGRSVNDVWLRGLKLIMDYGLDVRDRRYTIREILNLATRIEYPHDEYPSLRHQMLREYEDQLLNPDNKGFIYTYGERLRRDVDQIQLIINKLKHNRTSKRGTATTWMPKVDLTSSESPCLIMVDFKLRNSILEMTSVFRSHDFYGAYPYNVHALSRLQDYVANELSVSSGGINILSVSAHIYERDLKDVECIIQGGDIRWRI